MERNFLEHKIGPILEKPASDETKVLSGISDWLIGLLSIGIGFIAINIGWIIFCIPLVLATVAVVWFSGSELTMSGEPLMLIWIAWTPVLLWFAFRFYYPVLFDLVKLSGFFLQKLADVRPTDVIVVVKQRAMNMVNDFRLWTGWFHGKN